MLAGTLASMREGCQRCLKERTLAFQLASLLFGCPAWLT
jgi:hypothetical protein